jgi:hypothetical protein
MVKEAKFFRMQAIKAERLARATVDDVEASLNFSNLAQAYRSQADTIKKAKKKKAARKKSPEAEKKTGKLKDKKIKKLKNKRTKKRGP